MSFPLQVTFRDVMSSDALREDIIRHADRLQRFAADIVSGRVVVEYAERHHHQGNRYVVHLHVHVPGREFEAGQAVRDAHTDPYVAVRDAFDAMRRQLEDFEQKRRGEVKARAAAAPVSDE